MNKIIILNNKKCQLEAENDNITRKLSSRLSFQIAGVEFTQAFQNGWDGFTRLLSKSNKFDLGLLSNVISFFNEQDLEVEVEDRRVPKEVCEPLDISKNSEKLGLVPRDYQLRALAAVEGNEKGIVRSCTGSGKTYLAAMITAKINKPTIIYCIGLDIMSQFHKLFSNLFDEGIGIVGNGECEIHRINICTIWTIAKSLDLDSKKLILDDEINNNEISPKIENCIKIREMLQNTKVHILDECHVVTTATISHIYKHIDPEHIIGLSGTPYRADNSELLSTAILGEKIVDISASELISKGILAQPFIKFIPVPRKTFHSENYQQIYKEYVVENQVRNKLIIDSVKELIEKKYTPLILFKHIRHGDILYKMLIDEGIDCRMLYGNDSLKRRNEVKEEVNNKKVNVVLASTIYDMGVDIPTLSALVLCGSGKSYIRALQRVGRCIRMCEGKRRSCVVDFFDQCRFLKSHSLTRYKVYSSEPGFKIISCKEMKKDILKINKEHYD